MAKRIFADYHGYRLWIESLGPQAWKIWVVGPAANGSGGKLPPRKTVMAATAQRSDFPSEIAARDFAVAWVRNDYLGYLNPVDEPAWYTED